MQCGHSCVFTCARLMYQGVESETGGMEPPQRQSCQPLTEITCGDTSGAQLLESRPWRGGVMVMLGQVQRH